MRLLTRHEYLSFLESNLSPEKKTVKQKRLLAGKKGRGIKGEFCEKITNKLGSHVARGWFSFNFGNNLEG